MRCTRTVTRLGAASIIGMAMMASPQVAIGESRPELQTPTITGTPVVGETLTAAAVATGDPAPTLAYQWIHCAPKRASCDPIAGATGPTYVVSATYLGRRLAVRVRAQNSAGAA